MDKLLTSRNGNTGHTFSLADVKARNRWENLKSGRVDGADLQRRVRRLVRMETFCCTEVWKVIRGGRRLRGRAETGHPCPQFCSSEPQTSGTKSFVVSEHVMEL